LIEYEQSLPADLRHGLVPDFESVCRTYDEPNGAFLAADADDAVGCVAVTHLDASRALVLRLFVRPNARGGGTGRKLVDAALAFLRDRGYARVVLDTDKARLSAAYNLYLSLGFTECEPYGPVDYPSPTYMDLDLRD
jgi:GNAT superfamily N-acetyltransferase